MHANGHMVSVADEKSEAIRERSRIIWISYLHPEGFDPGVFDDDDVLVEYLNSHTAAVQWAARNQGAAIAVIVIVVAFMPDLDYDPALILQTLRKSIRRIRFVIAVRENGPLFRPSHYAFTAEFREICGHPTIVAEADWSTTRPAGQASPRPGRGGKPADPGVRAVSERITSRWQDIARQALERARGTGRLSPPEPSETEYEAMRLVQAMRRSGSRADASTLALVDKRLMVALSLPGGSMQSGEIAGTLGYTPKDIMNRYSVVANVVRNDDDRFFNGAERNQRASDFCKQLGRDYQEWLISFGMRHKLLPAARALPLASRQR